MLCIPDGVVEPSEKCFCNSTSLQRIVFGASSKLERICAFAFADTSIELLRIPDGVVELGAKCSFESTNLHCVSFGAELRLERLCAFAFFDASLESVCIPNRVTELGNGCFYDCKRLQSGTFGPLPQPNRTWSHAFCMTTLEPVCIPDGVIELCEYCFYECKRTKDVTFGQSVHRKRTKLLCIPDSVAEPFSSSRALTAVNDFWIDISGVPISSNDAISFPNKTEIPNGRGVSIFAEHWVYWFHIWMDFSSRSFFLSWFPRSSDDISR